MIYTANNSRGLTRCLQSCDRKPMPCVSQLTRRRLNKMKGIILQHSPEVFLTLLGLLFDTALTVTRLQQCITHINHWMSTNQLIWINKTELLWAMAVCCLYSLVQTFIQVTVLECIELTSRPISRSMLPM